MPTAAVENADGVTKPLKQMRKGTKSCMECRRRKIKCNYPESPATSPAGSISAPKKCIECNTHDRTCQIQGIVVAPSVEVQPITAANQDSSSAKKPRIYKRRRPVDPSPPQSEDEGQQPRMKIHIDRMQPVVGRIARQLGHTGEQPQDPGLEGLEGSNGLDPELFNELDPSNFNLDDSDAGFSVGNAFTQALGFDMASTQNWTPPVDEAVDSEFEILQFPAASFRQSSLHGANGTPLRHWLPPSAPGRSSSAPVQKVHAAAEEPAKSRSPLMCQLFNNEMFSQTKAATQIMTEKLQTLTFSETTAYMTDASKLLSILISEPYILEVLDVSTKWWLAWRDQAFALQDAFMFSKDETDEATPSLSHASNASSSTDSSTRNSPNSSTRQYSNAQPISLRDFVHAKLAKMEDGVSLATALLCIGMSLEQVRHGTDDSKLNISTTPAELADRITLAVDTIILAPTANPEYVRDPGVLLLLMMRAKMHAESNQLRKSWLSTRRALDIAKSIGFAELKVAPDTAGGRPKMNEAELTKLFHRQRFIGSIMELDRMMSMVLGFPHAEDVKFTDRLALSVLKDAQVKPTEDQPSATCDIKMRALRRVVSIVAGRINDRNSSTASDEALHKTTAEIQGTLDFAYAAMRPGWWVPEHHLGSEPFTAHEHLVAQMWFWQVQAFLHLPFMLKPNPNMRGLDCHAFEKNDPYEANRILCLEGCRRMLRVFSHLRSNPSLALFICSCEDFQGVFSACILMVGLLIRLTFCPMLVLDPMTKANNDVRGDLALIEEIKDVFRYRGTQQGGYISKQGVKVLEELGSFLVNDTGFDGDEPRRRTVVLPYFGAIHLELRPPRHLREILRTQALQSLGSSELTPATSNEALSDDIIDSSSSNEALPPAIDWTAEDFDIDIPFEGLPGDQFLFGTELGRDWDAQLPEWPVDESMWEWR